MSLHAPGWWWMSSGDSESDEATELRWLCGGGVEVEEGGEVKRSEETPVGGSPFDGGKVDVGDASVCDTKKVDSCVETRGGCADCIGSEAGTQTEGGDLDSSERDGDNVLDGCESDDAVTVRDGIVHDSDASGLEACDSGCDDFVEGVDIDIEDVNKEDLDEIDTCVETSDVCVGCIGSEADSCTGGGG